MTRLRHATRIRGLKMPLYATSRAFLLLAALGALVVIPIDATSTLGRTTRAVSYQRSKMLPKDAADVIRAAADSADRREFHALRALMVDAFTWSFGGDQNASEAIAEWQKEPRYLREMVRVLRKGCRLAKTTEVECPGRGGLSFRAGFIKSAKGWRMNYFVEGD